MTRARVTNFSNLTSDEERSELDYYYSVIRLTFTREYYGGLYYGAVKNNDH